VFHTKQEGPVVNHHRRTLLVSIAASAAGMAIAHRALALNPQPEVPSKNTGKTRPKALNPQPEVPSKGRTKKKKKSKRQDKKKLSQPTR